MRIDPIGSAPKGLATRPQPHQVRPARADVYQPAAPSVADFSERDLQMVKAGLPLRPELPKSAELQQALASAGLSESWSAVEKAYLFAKKAHDGQSRDDGSAYYHHPVRAALNAVKEFGVRDVDAINAALLHDVLEDTSVTEEEMKTLFGEKTTSYVKLMSKPDPLLGESYSDRNARYLDRLESAGNRDVIALKLADRMDNIEDTHLMPDRSKIARYLVDTREHYLPLADRHFPEAGARIALRADRIQGWLGSGA